MPLPLAAGVAQLLRDAGHKVAAVRHPMYLGVLVMFLATPLALGSWWAVIPVGVLTGPVLPPVTVEPGDLEVRRGESALVVIRAPLREAVTLHFVENMDAKAAAFIDAVEALPEGSRWTDYQRMFERYLFSGKFDK